MTWFDIQTTYVQIVIPIVPRVVRLDTYDSATDVSRMLTDLYTESVDNSALYSIPITKIFETRPG